MVLRCNRNSNTSTVLKKGDKFNGDKMNIDRIQKDILYAVRQNLGAKNEKDISFDDKIEKGKEYINSAIKAGAKNKEDVLLKLKEEGLHRDAIYFIDNNFDNKAVEELLGKQEEATPQTEEENKDIMIS